MGKTNSNKNQESKASISEIMKAGLQDRLFYRLYILGLLLIFCSLLYYFGEIIDYFKLESLHWNFFYAVHDVQRLLFLAPILYAAHVFGAQAVIIITIISGGIWMPRAIFISPYPDPLIRAILFLVVEGAMGYLTASIFKKNRLIGALEKEARIDRDRFQNILERMTDGVIIVGSDYKIRFANEAMKKTFGKAPEQPCYKYIFHYIEPCDQRCQLQEVIKGNNARWEYFFPDGTVFEVEASPYVDTDGETCQLAIYRDITHLKKAQKA